MMFCNIHEPHRGIAALGFGKDVGSCGLSSGLRGVFHSRQRILQSLLLNFSDTFAILCRLPQAASLRIRNLTSDD